MSSGMYGSSEMSLVSVLLRDVPGNIPGDVPRDVPMDIPGDVPKDVLGDIPGVDPVRVLRWALAYSKHYFPCLFMNLYEYP